MTKNAHCPICKHKIGLPVWLAEKFGKLYAAYCNRCKRAYKTNEILWK